MKANERDDEVSVFEEDDKMYLITWKRWLVLAIVILINMSVAMVSYSEMLLSLIINSLAAERLVVCGTLKYLFEVVLQL